MDERRVHACRPGMEAALAAELRRAFPGVTVETVAEGFLACTLDAQQAQVPVHLAFSAQCLPSAVDVEGASARELAVAASAVIAPAVVQHAGAWRLHAFCHEYRGSPVRAARVERVRDAVVDELRKSAGGAMRGRAAAPDGAWREDELLVQVALATPTRAVVSVCDAVARERLRAVMSRFPGGRVVIPEDKRPPSRAHLKLREALRHMGTTFQKGETVVDLGASPGGWTWVAVEQGARVTAVDRSPLRADVMRHPAVKFVEGDAFSWEPKVPVDWLVCDLIAFPERTVTLLRHWTRQKLCRKFCVTVKFRGDEDHGRLEDVKGILRAHAAEFVLRQLDNNKNEITAWGTVRA
ncbi:MAG: hypothetical protein HY904_17665 [Deltaproteobacteria bacterium]|nr:hypothetical protein [Deltaproteobacteria bacterium]